MRKAVLEMSFVERKAVRCERISFKLCQMSTAALRPAGRVRPWDERLNTTFFMGIFKFCYM